jgi:hypothetical protein
MASTGQSWLQWRVLGNKEAPHLTERLALDHDSEVDLKAIVNRSLPVFTRFVAELRNADAAHEATHWLDKTTALIARAQSSDTRSVRAHAPIRKAHPSLFYAFLIFWVEIPKIIDDRLLVVRNRIVRRANDAFESASLCHLDKFALVILASPANKLSAVAQMVWMTMSISCPEGFFAHAQEPATSHI